MWPSDACLHFVLKTKSAHSECIRLSAILITNESRLLLAGRADSPKAMKSEVQTIKLLDIVVDLFKKTEVLLVFLNFLLLQLHDTSCGFNSSWPLLYCYSTSGCVFFVSPLNSTPQSTRSVIFIALDDSNEDQ